MTVPHFAKMAEMMGVMDKGLKTLSYRYATTLNLIKEICDNAESTNGLSISKLNQLEFKEVERYINDRLIYDYLTTHDLSITLKEGDKYYTGPLRDNIETVHNTTKVIKLDSVAGIATFKR